jgi:hypothetical protein
MNFTRFIGRRLVVDYHLLKDLRIHLARDEGRMALVVEGSIMESAKVFEALKVKTNANTIFVTVYASLPFWNRSGSPDFKATSELTLSPGTYEIRYAGTGSETTFLKKVNVED